MTAAIYVIGGRNRPTILDEGCSVRMWHCGVTVGLPACWSHGILWTAALGLVEEGGGTSGRKVKVTAAVTRVDGSQTQNGCNQGPNSRSGHRRG